MHLKESNEKPIRVLERAVSILDCFDLDETHLTLRDVSEKIGLSTSTTSRLLNSLVSFNLLKRDSRDKSYCLGPKLHHYGLLAKDNISIVKFSYPLMKIIRDKTKEAVTLYVLEDGYRVCYENVESLLTMKCVVRIGDRFPLWAGAAGKCILAYAEEPLVLEEIAKASPITSTTITDRDQFMEDLALVRERGYAISYGEREEGVTSIAVPIFEPPYRIFGCISVAGPTVRFSKETINDLLPELKETCAKISRSLGT